MVIKLVFYIGSTLSILFGLMTILAKKTIYNVLGLCATFVCVGALWLLLNNEFLAWLLIFLYVGAILVLFLFAIMLTEGGAQVVMQRKYDVLWLILPGVLGYIIYRFKQPAWVFNSNKGINIQQIALTMFTEYLPHLELVAAILLVVMVLVVSVRKKRISTKMQKVSQQVMVNKSTRLTLVEEL